VSWEAGVKATVEWYRQHPDYWADDRVAVALRAHPTSPVKLSNGLVSDGAR
jgi:hypothetical protein